MNHLAVACIGLLALTGCQGGDAAPVLSDAEAQQQLTGSGAESTDCVSPLAFASRSYTLVLGPEVEFVRPGQSLGSGQYPPCADGGGGGVDNREVYALPGVPVEQAVVVGLPDKGAVLVNRQAPSDGWDADLLALLNQWKVDVPQSR